MGKRVGIVDEIRGIAFISMVIYHVYYDIAFIYGVNLPDVIDLVMKWLQPLIAGTFIAVAGISSNYSKNNFKRGALYFFVGMVMTILVQSSSATDIMVIGFVNSGMMTLFQALGVIAYHSVMIDIDAQTGQLL